MVLERKRRVKVDTNPLSYSSMSEFKKCERKYFLRKIAKVETDPDFIDDKIYFKVGKAFHQTQEDTLHEFCNLSAAKKMDVVRKCCKEHGVLDVESLAVVASLAEVYSRYHVSTGTKVVGCEPEIRNAYFIGFLDAVVVSDKGWWIVDLKTAGKADAHWGARMSQDPQLNLYASVYREVAEMYHLRPELFLGVSYRSTLKPKIRRKSGERVEGYIQRLVDSGKIRTYDVVVGLEELSPGESMEGLRETHEHIQKKLKVGKEAFCKNYASCIDYFKPCGYWSNCHGATYTQKNRQAKIFDTDNPMPRGYLPGQGSIAGDEEISFDDLSSIGFSDFESDDDIEWS